MIFLLRIFLIQYYFNNIGWNYINKVDSIILIISILHSRKIFPINRRKKETVKKQSLSASAAS